MTHDGNDRFGRAAHHAVSRRAFVGGSAVVAASLLTGALFTNGARVVVAQDGKKTLQGTWPYQSPPVGHFNTFVPSAILGPPNIYGDLVWQPMALFYWASRTWLPLLATDWAFIKAGGSATVAPEASPAMASPAAAGSTGSIPAATAKPFPADADALQVKLRQGVTWTDGSDFGAPDLLATFSILRLQGNTVWQYLDKVEAVDDHTVNFHMSTPSSVVERYVIRYNPQPASVYGEWAKKADDLFASGKKATDPEGKQLADQFSKFRPDKVVANGPFTIDPKLITDSQVVLQKNPQGWNADTIAFDQIISFNGDNAAASQLAVAKKLDYATNGFLPPVEKQMKEEGIRIVRPPIYSGPAVMFNYAKVAAFKDKRARQGLAHMIDRAENGLIGEGESGIALKYMCGMSDNLVPVWMEQDDIAKLNQYPLDPEKGAALLTEAGWKKEGSTWKTPDGKDAKFTLSVPNFGDWSASAQDLTEQLNKQGFQLEVRVIDQNQIPIEVDNGNFEIAIQGWGSSANPHPHFSYTTAFFTHNTLAKGGGMAYPLTQQSEVAGGEVDLEKLTLATADGLDEAAQKQKVSLLARIYNELLPVVPIWERYGNNPVLDGPRVTGWPPDGDPIYINSPYADGIVTMLMLTDVIKPL